MRDSDAGELAAPSAYGPRASALLTRARAVAAPAAREYIESFHRELASEAGLAEIFERLTPEDVDRLKDAQLEHVLWLLDPALVREAVLERGRRTGRLHSMVAVESDWYVNAVALFQNGLVERLGLQESAADQLAFQHVMSTRIVHHLEGVLRGYRDLESQQSQALHTIGEVAEHADTVADLASGVLEALTGLEGFAGGLFGRPDAEDPFQLEIGIGEGVIELTSADSGVPPITTVSSVPNGQGPAGRAWRSGKITRSDAYLKDPTTEPWHDLGKRHGWRSSAVVPLSRARGGPRALLSLYASYPGYFAQSARSTFLSLLRQAVEPALARLEARTGVGAGAGAGVIAYTARASYLRKLAAREVEMRYQPVVELATGRLLKLEALARLEEAGHLVAPGQFLPAFGDDELFSLFEIGLDKALHALGHWELDGLETAISLNLPPSGSTDPRYSSAVKAALGRFGVSPARLTLELLENGAIEPENNSRGRHLEELKRFGVRLAQDDLGSGYSSLLRLRNIAFDEVKIDQALMRGAATAPRAALHFIEPLANLARSMGISTVVEGLETAGLIEAAVFLGADAGQGYAIARPLELSAVHRWASSFRLDFDFGRPRTELGGLAAHLAWESRLTALGGVSGLLGVTRENACPLSTYIDEYVGQQSALANAHRALHVATLRSPRSDEYRQAWKSVESLLLGDLGGGLATAKASR